MPQFRFRVSDTQGQIRSGRLSASDKNDALARLDQAGYTVLEMQEVGGDSPLTSPVASSNYRAPRVEPLEISAPWWVGLAERMPSGNMVGIALALTGLLWGALTWTPWATEASTANKRARDPVEMAQVPVNVTVQGEVSMPDTQDFGDVSIVLDFPEVPCQLSRPWSELKHPQPGQFIYKTEFMAALSPLSCVVKARKAGHTTALSRPLNLRIEQPVYKVQLALKREVTRPVMPRPRPRG